LTAPVVFFIATVFFVHDLLVRIKRKFITAGAP
jgi:hypothetical protein